jgi:hypothetical protein
MKMIPGFLVLAFICGCATVPSATKSTFLSTDNAGLRYKNGHPESAAAMLWLKPQPSAPEIMYVEVVFPDPSQANGQEVIRKEIKKADGIAKFDGTEHSGWKPSTTYTFIARVYSDASYQTLLGVHEQPCLSSSEEALRMIKQMPKHETEPSPSASGAAPGH